LIAGRLGVLHQFASEGQDALGTLSYAAQFDEIVTGLIDTALSALLCLL
jgi:hypothetical protein